MSTFTPPLRTAPPEVLRSWLERAEQGAYDSAGEEQVEAAIETVRSWLGEDDGES